MALVFSTDEAVRYGWDTMKKNLGFFIGLVAILGLISFLDGAIRDSVGEGSVWTFPVILIFFIIEAILNMGVTRISLNIVDGRPGEYGDLLACMHLLMRYIGASFLYLLIILLGTILLIVPGIVWGIKYQFFGYFIIDREMSPVEALKASAVVTQGIKWPLFLFDLIMVLIMAAGLLALIVGLFAALPTVIMAQAFVYRRLTDQADAAGLLPLEQQFES